MASADDKSEPESAEDKSERRDFLSVSSTIAMGVGIGASYGTLGVMAGRYLYPSSGPDVSWLLAAVVAEVSKGDSFEFIAPSGLKVVIAKQGDGNKAEDFVALSSVCPHLGCAVHWEGNNNRFFCPCHNGVFDPSGKPLEGPPAKAGQRLIEFPLKVENETLLYVQVPTKAIV